MKKAKYWIITNAVGLSVYFYFAVPTWLTPTQQDIPWEGRAAADPIYAAATDLCFIICGPLLFLYLAINFIWLIVILANIRKKKFFILLLIWILVVTAWLIGVLYDRYRASFESPRLQEFRKSERIYP